MNNKIVVVMGGPSSEAEVSRRTGAAVVKALKERGHAATGVEFTPKTFANDIAALSPAIVFNAIHGAFGEDGRLAAILEALEIPYTGSGVLAAAQTIDKCAAKYVLRANDIPTPRASSFCRHDDRAGQVKAIEREFRLPVVVKAAAQGSSIGVVIVEKADELFAALEECFRFGDFALVEEFIAGPELTVAVIGGDGKCEAMPIIEIVTGSGRYDYESKYTVGASTHIIPARISQTAAARARNAALKTFAAFGLKGVARIDVMLAQGDVPNVIDINTVPGMTETSLVPDASRAMGVSFGELCEKMLALAGYRL